ncbi:kinase-like domain-containing protein [Lipomyces japonicus]|uniref:kinase-like domain-containing protein n=1 Tax=Lipomyces japonicus TaxID=56871 RepID=UPI0034CD3A1D
MFDHAAADATPDETGNSSDDDSYALPVLSSYALALLSTSDGAIASGIPSATDHLASLQIENNQPLNSSTQITMNTPTTGSSHGTGNEVNHNTSSPFVGSVEGINDNNNASTSSPHTQHNMGVALSGLVTPALTTRRNSALKQQNSVEPTSQYRSIFRKSKPGRLGPPKRAIRRESQEGTASAAEEDQIIVSGDDAGSDQLHGGMSTSHAAAAEAVAKTKLSDEDLGGDEFITREATKIRFSEKDDEIPRGTTVIHLNHSPTTSSSDDRYESNDKHQQPIQGPDTYDHTGKSFFTRNNTSITSINPASGSIPSDNSQDIGRRPADASQPPHTRKLVSPPPPMHVSTIIDQSGSPIVSSIADRRYANRTSNGTPYSERVSNELRSGRSLLSPRFDSAGLTGKNGVDGGMLRARPISSMFRDENALNKNQKSHNNRQPAGMHLQATTARAHNGRQMLTPISANVGRPLRTSTPPPDCEYAPPPKMSILNVPPRPTPKTVKKAKNSVVVAGNVYQRLELLGKGGSSKVYKVQLANSTKIYAMKKVTFDEVDEAVVKGFKGEIELLRKLSDEERVVRLVDYEIFDGCVNMVMECGEIDFAHVLAARMHLPLDMAFIRYYMREMLHCVEAVHQHGIVHSDLKPANFLLVKGMLKIIDFGIANAVPEYTANVRRETQNGTPNYMAPEALLDVSIMDPTAPSTGKKCMKVGRPSDVWSCGCIIYQMIYGKPPYAAYNGTQRLLAIMNPKVQIIYPETGLGGAPVPHEAITVIKRCLDRDPPSRATIADVLQGPFLMPRVISRDILKELMTQSVMYGAEHRTVEHGDIEMLVEDVWRKIGLLNRNTG